MRVASTVLMVLLASATAAQAMCEDDLNNVRLKVERAQKTDPSPQTIAAAKELQQYDERTARAGEEDELDCHNTVARVERALEGQPAVNNTKPGEAVGPVNERATSVE